MIDLNRNIIHANNESNSAAAGASLVGMLAASVINGQISKQQLEGVKRIKRRVPLMGCFASA